MELKKQNKKELILEGDMYKAIFIIAFPIMINNLIQTLYSLADAIWVSKLGSVEFCRYFICLAYKFSIYFYRIWYFYSGLIYPISISWGR